ERAAGLRLLRLRLPLPRRAAGPGRGRVRRARVAAWKKGVRDDWAVTRVDGVKDPSFHELRVEVALSGSGKHIPFEFRTPAGGTIPLTIEPRRDYNDAAPVIGIAPPGKLELWPEKEGKRHELPVRYHSAAAAARAVDLRPGDVVVRATNPDNEDELTPL